LQKVEDIKLAKVQRQWLRLGFREEIVETLQADPAGGRELDIAHTKQTQRQRRRARGLEGERLPTLKREKTLTNITFR